MIFIDLFYLRFILLLIYPQLVHSNSVKYFNPKVEIQPNTSKFPESISTQFQNEISLKENIFQKQIMPFRPPTKNKQEILNENFQDVNKSNNNAFNIKDFLSKFKKRKFDFTATQKQQNIEITTSDNANILSDFVEIENAGKLSDRKGPQKLFGILTNRINSSTEFNSYPTGNESDLPLLFLQRLNRKFEITLLHNEMHSTFWHESNY